MQPVSVQMQTNKYSNEYKKTCNVHDDEHDSLVDNNFITRTRIGYDKFMNAATIYTGKGFKGNKNSNFYEFLSMGMIPYAIGSAMLIWLFNAGNAHFNSQTAKAASRIGVKAGIGVLLYPIFKSFSKKLIEEPIKWGTGVDLNQPYRKVVKELPTIDKPNPKSIEYHKVFESTQFPRVDLLYKKPEDFSNIDNNLQDGWDISKTNEYYDKIAEKLGYGNNLLDSDQIIKPKIKEISTRAKTLSYLLSPLWAAIGVAIAWQEPWEKLVDRPNASPILGKNLSSTCANIGKKALGLFSLSNLKAIGKCFKESVISFYNGGITVQNKNLKYFGRGLLFTTAALTALGTAFTIIDAYNHKKTPSKETQIDKTKNYTVS